MNAREGSKRVDKVLVSDTFTDKDRVAALVRNHILHSPSGDGDHKSEPHDQVGGDKHIDAVTGYWTEKVWKFLEEVRGASLTHTSKLVASHENSRDWNVKDESDRFRVMYREGPVGTPFHTLCLDGLVDGDVSSGMCVAWESPMFKEWWPQTMVPTFKIVESKWIRRVRVGEDVSIMRFKVPWPMAQREVIMSSFELEFFQDDLIIGLIDSVPEAVEEINEKLHGFSAADLPPPSSDVRIEIAGGFIMQRISDDQFFFRTIMNMDMKLDLVPPWVINFVSRQLAGQGLKLYQKAVLAVAHGTGNGKAFQKLLKTGQLYQRIRSGLENKTADTGQLTVSPIGRLPTYKDSVKSKTLQGSIRRMGNSENNRIVPYPVKGDGKETVLEEGDAILAVEPTQPQSSSAPLVHTSPVNERNSEEISFETASSSNRVDSSKKEVSQTGHEKREYRDPEVEWAVTILDKMILFTRACAAQSSVAATEKLARKVESTSDLKSKLDLNELEEKHHDKSRVPSANGQSSHILVPRQVKEEKMDNQNAGRLSVGARPESCPASGFMSTSEIEIVDSQDDADSHPVKVGDSLDSKPEAEELEVAEGKGKSRKWSWACFSPRHMRRNRNRRANLFRDGSADFERGSRRYGRILRENSSRFVKERDYVTDVEAKTGRYKLENRASSAQRTSTLGELLMEAPK